MKNVVVSGASGFLGSRLCKRLSDYGVNVIALVRNSSGTNRFLSQLENVHVICCDMSDYKSLNKDIWKADIDCFYHFAWYGSAGDLRGDYETQLENIRYTCDAVHLAQMLNCKRFIYAASVMEYEVQKAVQNECGLVIQSIYSTAKLSADYMARAVANSLNVEYISVVISNVYGPGECSYRLINTTIKKLIHHEYCRFSAGEQLYDFIYIDDAVEAFYLVGLKGIGNKNYYVGSHNPQPLKLFLKELRDVVAPGVEIGLGELEFNGVSLTYEEFDKDALYKDTGFINQVDFKTGIMKTMQWIKSEGFSE